MGIRESALNTIASLANGDFVRMVTAAGASRKASLQSIAQHILETYTGTSLAGSNQSVKSAIDGLNSTTAYSITASASSDVHALSYYKKYGKIRVLHLRATLTAGLVNAGVIATVSQPFTHDFQFPAMDTDGKIYRVRCNDTRIMATGTIPSGTILFLDLTECE